MDRKGSSPPEAFGRWKSQRRFHRKIAKAIDRLGSSQGSIVESVFDPAAEGEGQIMTCSRRSRLVGLLCKCSHGMRRGADITTDFDWGKEPKARPASRG